MVRFPGALALLLAGGIMRGGETDPAEPRVGGRPVEAHDVALLPHPGTSVPGAIGFAPDSSSVTFLKSETRGLDRVLWRADVSAEAKPRVVARPPDGGDTDANVSAEERLRRERQRLRDTGITHVIRAGAADVAILPIGGDLYLQAGKGALRRLTRTPEPEIDPQPSPDGERVAFVRGGELFALDVATGTETRLSKVAGEGRTHGLAEFIAQEELGRSSGFWWSPEGSRIAYQQTDERSIPPFTIAHLGDASYATETHRYPFAGGENATVRLGVVSSSGGTTTWLNLGEPEDESYLARVDWDGPRRLLVQLLARDQKSLRLCRIDVNSGDRTLLVEERSSTFVNLHDDLRLVPETGEILWSSERSGYRHLELRDRDGRMIRPLTAGEWPVDAVLGLDARRREVWFASGRGSPLEIQAFRVSLDGGAAVAVTDRPGTHRVVVAPDGEHYVDTFSDRHTPPITTLHRRDGSPVDVLDDASADPRIARFDLSPPLLTEFPNRDGVRLFGAYYAPRQVHPGARVPVVVMVYGGPHVQTVTDSWAMTADLAAQFLRDRGFGVWKVDNRGSSRRGVAFESALYRNMGEVEVRDQQDGLKFLAASQPEIDPDRVGITGGSYGGYMTLRCLMLAPETFRAGVAVAPVTDWDGYDTGYTERYMGTPADNPEGYRASSVVLGAEKIAGDLLVIHGMLDENVHFRHSARLVRAMIAFGLPFEFLPIPDERHSSRKLPERTYITDRLGSFFERTLRGPKRGDP